MNPNFVCKTCGYSISSDLWPGSRAALDHMRRHLLYHVGACA